MKRIMVDIETLATTQDASVIAIGLCSFDTTGVTDSAHLRIQRKDWHGLADPQTVGWWMEQSDAARNETFLGADRIAADVAAYTLSQFAHGADEVWANDPSFDVSILRRWWARVAEHHPAVGAFPIHYRVERSCRTIYSLARARGADLSQAWAVDFVAHNALEDACAQARAVILARQALMLP